MNNPTAEQLGNMEMGEVLTYIRKVLAFPKAVTNSLRGEDLSKAHYRFDMSGTDGNASGSNTIHNLTIINKFAHLGIYDYTKFITLDFYKGHGTIYFQYWNEDTSQEVDMGGYGTCEIIYEIFSRTIFTNKPKRRRD